MMTTWGCPSSWGLGDYVMLVQKVMLVFWNNFCMASISLNCLFTPWLVLMVLLVVVAVVVTEAWV